MSQASRATRILCMATLIAHLPLPANALDVAPWATLAWSTGPLEVRVAFDRPVDSAFAATLVGQSITFQVDPSTSGALKIAAAQIGDDPRIITLLTDPHPWDTEYQLPLNQRALTYNLSGVEAIQETDGGNAPPSTWWPSLELDDLRRLAKNSPPHKQSLAKLTASGQTSLHTFIRLPDGQVSLAFDAPNNITLQEVLVDGEPATLDDQSHHASLSLQTTGDPIELSIVLTSTPSTGDAPPQFHVSWQSENDGTPHPLTSQQTRVPWAPAPPSTATAPPPVPPDLTGGDPMRGKAVFFGEESKCATCHTVRGEGGKVGPDLSGAHEKPLARLLQDIAEPSAAVHPDYVPCTVVVKDGRVLSGIVRVEPGGSLRITDTNAVESRINRDQLEDIRPSATSIMPVGLAGALGDQALRDLLAFLATPEPTP